MVTSYQLSAISYQQKTRKAKICETGRNLHFAPHPLSFAEITSLGLADGCPKLKAES
jgi:hypothetical protein